MGISIKNEEIEAMLRQFADENALSLTEAIRFAIDKARENLAAEQNASTRAAAYRRYKAIVAERPLRSEAPWSREELFERE
jgi:hypothetical protein